MPVYVPHLEILLAFNAIFLAVFAYRRIREWPPLPGPLAVMAQVTFIAVNCTILFPEEAAFYAGSLMRLF
jgi:hypothetical protein